MIQASSEKENNPFPQIKKSDMRPSLTMKHSLAGLLLTSGLLLNGCGLAEEALDGQDLGQLEQETFGGDLGQSTGSPVATGNTCGRSNDFTPTCSYSDGTPDLSYTWTAPYTGVFTFSTLGSSLDTILEVRRDGDLQSLGCNDDASGTIQSELTLNLTAGQKVRAIIDGYGYGTCGNHRLNISGTPSSGVDLVITQIIRERAYYYRVTYCNTGGSASISGFTINLKNLNSGQSFETSTLYPFSVPPPGTCAVTGGITCGLIGDPDCNLPITVEGHVDFRNTVTETSETNNKLTVSF